MPSRSSDSSTMGENVGRYVGRLSHPASPCVFMYDQRLSTSSETLASGRAHAAPVVARAGAAAAQARQQRGRLRVREADGLVHVERAVGDLRRVDDRDVRQRGGERRQPLRRVVECRYGEHFLARATPGTRAPAPA